MHRSWRFRLRGSRSIAVDIGLANPAHSLGYSVVDCGRAFRLR
jgi:hypothetical protein